MTNKIGPVDPNMIAKVGNKIDESRPAERTSVERPAPDGAAQRPEAAADTATESVDEDEKAAPPADDEDLGDAADRLAKLEATLDKLSEKLAELDEE